MEAIGIQITNDGCARPGTFFIEGAPALEGPWTILAAATAQVRIFHTGRQSHHFPAHPDIPE